MISVLSGAAEGNANEQDGSLAHLAKTEVCSSDEPEPSWLEP